MDIGIVDLDTSHPQNWIPILRELGHNVVGLYDHGDVHPPGYARDFAAKLSVSRVFGSLEDMASAVDCAVVHACDWDAHVARARPFVEAGKAVLLDKPVAGRLSDLDQIRSWVSGGARISGGSSLRFCDESLAYLRKPVSERGTPHTVVCGCAVDEFNYGIHAYAMLAGLLGTGARSVRHLGRGVQRRVEVRWADGRTGLLVVGQAAKWLPFYATIATEQSVTQFIADNKGLYRALLAAALPYLEGKAPPPVRIEDLLEPEVWALAAKQSWEQGDREVALSDLSPATAYDGPAFARAYRAQRYPGS
jgi:predicted dehydrogenase